MIRVRAPDVPFKEVIPEVALLTLAVMVTIAFLIVDTIGGNSTWFQRSGVIAIVVGLMMESRIQRLLMKKNFINAIRSHSGEEVLAVSPARNFVSGFSSAVIIFGTAVTGYGDMMVSMLRSLL